MEWESQYVLSAAYTIKMVEEVEELEETIRGKSGFGSTGKCNATIVAQISAEKS